MKLEVAVRRPVDSFRPNPLLFVHGYWHAAWCWTEHFLPYFAQQGAKSKEQGEESTSRNQKAAASGQQANG